MKVRIYHFIWFNGVVSRTAAAAAIGRICIEEQKKERGFHGWENRETGIPSPDRQ